MDKRDIQKKIAILSNTCMMLRNRLEQMPDKESKQAQEHRRWLAQYEAEIIQLRQELADETR